MIISISRRPAAFFITFFLTFMDNLKIETEQAGLLKSKRDFSIVPISVMALQAVFIGHKLNACGAISRWSWIKVFSPLLLMLMLFAMAAFIQFLMEIWGQDKAK